MTGAPGIDSLFGDLDRMIATASAAAEVMRESREKDLVSAAVTRLKALRAGADAGVKGSLDVLKGQCQAHLDRLADLQARIASTRAELDQAVAAATAPPAAPPMVTAVPAFTVDTALGARLRDDLLRRFGPPADDGPPPARPGKDVWENWT